MSFSTSWSIFEFGRIDLRLGALIGLGIQFGVAPEAIELAAILSFPKSPWAISSPMYHDANTFNALACKVGNIGLWFIVSLETTCQY